MPIVCMLITHPFVFSHSSVSGALAYFQFFAITSNVAVSIYTQVFVGAYMFCFPDHTHKNEITKQYGNLILNPFMSYKAVLYTGDIL